MSHPLQKITKSFFKTGKSVKTGIVATFLALGLITPSLLKAQTSFTSGNLVVERVGDGSTTLSSAAAPIKFLEYTKSGTLVQTISAPASTITADGTSNSEGHLTLSADGTTLVFTAYTASPGTTSVSSNAASSILRGIGFVSSAGTATIVTTFANTATSSGAYAGGNLRGAYFNGTGIYASGNDATGGSGIHYTTTLNGSSSAGGTLICAATTNNSAGVNIYKDQLYFGSSKTTPAGVSMYNAIPAPTTAQSVVASTIVSVPGNSNDNIYETILLNTGNTNSSVASGAPDLMYTSDGGRISKFYWSGSSWTAAGTELHNAFAMTAVMNSSGTIDLYVVLNQGTSGNTIYKYTDGAARTSNLNTGGDSTLIASAGTDYTFNGISWAPSQTSPIAASAYATTLSTGNLPAGNYGDITIPFGVTVTLTGNIYINGTLNIQSSGVLKCGNHFVFSPPGSYGTFNLQSGGILYTGDDSGITNFSPTGSIQTFSRFYSPGAWYYYNATPTVAQVTGDGLPSSVFALIVSNTKGLTLSAPVSVTGDLGLNSGLMILGNNKLTVASGAVVSGGVDNQSYVLTNGTGVLEMTAGTTGIAFPVGTSDINIINVATTSGTAAFDVQVTSAITNSKNVAGTDHSVKRTWSITPQSSKTVVVTPGWDDSKDLTGSDFLDAFSFVSSRLNSYATWVQSQTPSADVNVSATYYNHASGNIAMSTSNTYQIGVFDSAATYNAVDAGVYSVVAPKAAACIGAQPVKVLLRNYGSSSLTAATINWSINGTPQTPYSWSGTLAGATSSVASVATVTVGSYTFATGNYTITAGTTNPNGIADSVNINDQVTANIVVSVPAASVVASQTICAGTEISIGSATADAGATYSWSPSTALSSSTVSNPTASPTSTTTYTLIETSSGGCVNSNTITITTKALPAANAGSSSTVCVGEAAFTIGAASVGSDTYAWGSTPSGGFTTTISNPSVQPTTTTSYTVTETGINGCSNSNSIKVTVSPIPLAAVAAAQTICAGSPVSIGSGTAVAGNTYSWSPSTALSSSTVSNPTASPTSTTSYTLTESNGGCSTSNSVTITTKTIPAANAGSSSTVCVGEAAFTIGAASVGSDTYAWGSTPSGLTSVISNPSVQPTTTTSYTVTETGTNGCSNSNSIKVTVSPVPLAAVAAAQTICAGSPVSIGSGTAVAGNTYSWSPSTALSSSTVSNPTASPTSATTYTLTESNGGCSTSNSVTITTKALPAASAGSPATVCAGTGASIGSSTVAGSTYSWSPSTALSSSTVSNPTASPTSTTSYTLTETNNGCSASNNVTITTKAIPAAVAGSSSTVCAGEAAFTIGAASVGSDTYAWGSTPSGLTSAISNPSVQPTTTTSYTVTETGTNGCSNSNSIKITVSPIPLAAVASAQTICAGSPVSIGSGTAVAGNTYSWSPSTALSSSTVSNPAASPTSTTSYTLTESNGGCSTSNSVTITTKAIPAANAGSSSTVCAGEAAFTIGAASVGSDTYAWGSTPSGLTSVISNPSVQPTTTTSYTVTETGTNGCSNSNSIKVTVSPVPLAAVAAAQTICAGSPVSIGSGTAVAGNTYSWSPSTALSSSTVSNPTASPTSATTYTLTESNGGCSTSNSVTITTKALPAASAGSPATVCAGTGASIGSSTVAGSTYSWSPSTALSSSTVSNPTASPTSTTSYTLTETNNGCSASNNVTITTKAIPAAVAGSSSTVCAGEAAFTIGAASVGSDTYAWGSTPSGLTSVISNPSVQPTTTTSYTITETGTNGCSNSNSIKITVSPIPLAAVASAQTICAGSPVSIGSGTAVAGNTYSWSPSTALSSSTVSNPTASPTSTTSYTLTESNGGCSTSNSMTITTKALPAAAAGSSSTVCSGEAAFTIGAASVGSDTYAWGSTPSGFTSAISNPSVQPTSTTTYTVTETGTNGCSNSNSIKVTVNPTPLATVAAAQTVCVGSPVSIGSATADVGATYAWSPSTALSSSTVSNPTASPTSTTSYTLIETNNGCSASNNVTITTKALPAAAAGSSSTVCSGEAAFTIGAASVGSDTYAWGSTPSGLTSVISNPSVQPTTTTSYTVTETGTNGCSNSNSIKVTVNPTPLAVVAGAQTICAGSPVSIGSATADVGATYAWSPSTALSSSTVSNPTASPTSATTYTLVETNGGCSASNSVSITTKALPAANAGSPATVCAGTGASIGSSTVAGSTYSWSPSTALSSSTVSNPTASPTSTTSYTLTETNNGCSASNSVTITTKAIPAAVAGSSSTVCAGEAAFTIGAASVGSDTYAWGSTPSGLTSVISNPSVQPTTTTSYTVTETGTNGCSNSNSIKITVSPIPLAAVASAQTICAGSPVSIGSGTAVAGNTYSWSPSTALSSSTVSNPTASPTSTTSYTLTESNGGCSTSNSVTITTKAIPAANAGSSSTVCVGEVAFTIGAASVGSDTYAWGSTPSGLTSVISNPSVQPTTTTSYTVTETGTNGCSNSNSIKVTVSPVPLAAVAAAQTICAGSPVSIGSGTAVAGNTYSWSPSTALSSSTVSNPTASPTSATTYTLTESNGGCSTSNSVTITTKAIPAANAGSSSTVCVGEATFTIGAASVGSDTYAWGSTPSGLTSVISNPSVQPTTTTSYTVTETGTNGCSNSNSIKVTVSPVPLAAVAAAQTICAGSPVSIGSGTAVAGNTYSWSPSTALSSSTVSNPTASPTSATTYTLTESNGGCSTSNSVIITTKALPAASAGSPATVCAGTGASIGSSTVAGSTYSWSPSTALSSSTVSNPTASPTSTTSYTLTETNNGCSASNNVTITTKAIPAAVAGSSSTVCAGEAAFTIGAASVGSDTYAWGSTPSGLTSVISNPSVQPTTTTSYTITETGTNGCSNSNSIKITVSPIPLAAVASAQTICAGSPVSIGSGTAVAGNTYSWSPSTALSSSTVSNPTASPTSTTSYTLTESNGGCSTSNSVTITTKARPAAAAGSSSTICAGEAAFTIGAASVGSDTYAWGSTPSGFTSAISNPSVQPTSTTTYTVTETGTNGCSNSNSVKVTINSLPAASVVASTAICTNSSISIGATAVSGSSYSWSGTGGYSSTVANPSVTPTSTSSYTLTETNSSTCTKTNALTITVNALPTAAVASPSTVCAGTAVSIGSATVTGSSYSWTSSAGGFSSTVSNPSVSPTSTTSYTLTETNANGCSKSNSVAITVNALPAAAVAPSVTVCSGTAVSIGSATVTGSSYSWASSAGGFSSTISNPSVSPTSTTTYTLTETNSNSCSASNSLTITTKPLPAAAAGSPQTFCAGEAAFTIGAASVSGSTYAWGSTPSGFSSTASNPSVQPTTTTTYTVTETGTNGCSNSNSVKVTVNPLPAASVAASTSICAGSSISIGATAVSGSSYSWSGTGGYSSTAANPSVTPTSTSSYTLTETNSATCSKTNALTITINALPAASVASPSTVCAGTAVSIGSATVTGSSYSWASSTGGFSSTISNPSVSPTSTTSYTLTETNANGCSKSNSVTITVKPLPLAYTGSNKNICLGNSLTIGGTAVSGNSYAWTSVPSGFTSTISSVTVTPSTTLEYILKESVLGLCSKTDTITITVNPLPAANAGTSSSICSGSSATIGSTAVTGDYYSWTSIPSGYTSTTSTASVTPAATTTYNVTESNPVTGCSNTNSVLVTISPFPAANAGSNSTICVGQSAKIGAAAVAGSTYSWASNPTGFGSTVSSNTVSPGASTIYTLTETNAIGCAKFNTVTITVNALPTANISANSSAICAGNTAILTTSSPVVGNTYQWNYNGNAITGATSSGYSASAAGSYYELVTNSGGCSAKSNVVTIKVNPLPDAIVKLSKGTSICQGDSVVLVATLDSNVGYQWSNLGTAISGATNYRYVATSSGTYQVRITSFSGCSDTATSVKVTVNPLPTATISSTGSTTFCSGGSVKLGAATTSGFSYAWYDNNLPISGATTNSYTATTSGSYSLQITNSTTGCSNISSDVTVTVNPIPATNVTALGNTTFCQGGSVVLVTDYDPTYTYKWSNASGVLSGETKDTITVKTSGTYTVTATNSGGCSATSSGVSVTASALPSISITKPTSTDICQGSTLTLNSTSGLKSYQWLLNGNQITGATLASYIVSQTGTYEVLATNTAGCSAHDTLSITVDPAPVAGFSTSANTICAGNSVNFYNQSSVSSGSLSYNWTFGDGGTANTSSTTHPYTTAGSYNVVLTAASAKGCFSTAKGVITVLSVNSSAFTTSSFGYERIVFHATDNTGSGFSWNFGDSTTGNGKSEYHQYPAAGTYTVTLTVTNANGCSSTTTSTVIVKSSAVDPDVSEKVSISVFPNPFETKTNVVYNLNQSADVAIEVFDITGKRVDFVDNTRQVAGPHSYIFSGPNPGTYFIKMLIDNKLYVNKVVQQ